MELILIAMVKTIPNCLGMFSTVLIFGVIALTIGCSDTDSTPQVEQACNGLVELCDRPLDQALFVGTHNAMSSSEDGWNFPNQEYAFSRQLQDGVRALNFDTYWWNEEAYLCHTYCDLGNMPLVEGLDQVAQFLAQNPDEVLLITIQSALEAEATLDAFVQTNLREQMYQHEVGSDWPTLRTLIEENRRLVVFTSDGGGNSGYMEQWVHWIDNPYSANSIEDFSCVEDRGNPETASLFNVNHFITNPVADIEDALLANQYDILWEHLERCQQETGRSPNQVLVDFYSQGDVLQVARDWNQLQKIE